MLQNKTEQEECFKTSFDYDIQQNKAPQAREHRNKTQNTKAVGAEAHTSNAELFLRPILKMGLPEAACIRHQELCKGHIPKMGLLEARISNGELSEGRLLKIGLSESVCMSTGELVLG